jgi:hypothetical protein
MSRIHQGRSCRTFAPRMLVPNCSLICSRTRAPSKKVNHSFERLTGASTKNVPNHTLARFMNLYNSYPDEDDREIPTALDF